MSDEVKRTRKSKAMYVAEALEAGLATIEELELMTVPQIKELAVMLTPAEDIPAYTVNDVTETLPEVVEPRPIQVVEKIPTCNHTWHKVRVVDDNGNYVCIRCYKCGAEKRTDD